MVGGVDLSAEDQPGDPVRYFGGEGVDGGRWRWEGSGGENDARAADRLSLGDFMKEVTRFSVSTYSCSDPLELNVSDPM